MTLRQSAGAASVQAAPSIAGDLGGKGAMQDLDTERVRELLREVTYPGYSRDIVGAGFVGQISALGKKVEIEFKPNTRDENKISEMERSMRDLLHAADFVEVQIHRVRPFATEVPLRSATELGQDKGSAPSGDHRLMTPLQAEMLEEGELPEADVLGAALGRADVAMAAGYGPEGPNPLSGPRESYSYESDIPVLQWSIDPHRVQAQTVQKEIKLGDWDYRVWWQVHESGDLLYVSMQAMREDWVDHGQDAVPHPVGRSEAVNLVYDETRAAVVAIYGTVRDFRPFVKAFGLAYASEQGSQGGPATEEADDQ